MSKKNVYVYYCFLLLCFTSCIKYNNIIDLSGKWDAEFDTITCQVNLPGSLSENGFGNLLRDSTTHRLSTLYNYTGKVAYTKNVNIPRRWEGRPLELFIERTKCSAFYIDGQLIGTGNTISSSQKFVCEKGLSAGVHKLKIEVDNTKSLLPLGGSHAYSEDTQTNWNGILGDVYLKCLGDYDLTNIRVNASLDGECNVQLKIMNRTSCIKDQLKLKIIDDVGKVCVDKCFVISIAHLGDTILNYNFKISNPNLWDEYEPNLYTLIIENSDDINEEIRFGFRNFTTDKGSFINNSRKVFLRGKHDGCVFPMTGYPSMLKDDWIKYFTTARLYGLNHIRFHSWTPPSAAFEAADELGIFLQVELPLWGNYSRKDTFMIDYMKNEGQRILEEFGNHPSFVMLSLGNELTGDTTVMREMVDYLREMDDRHLYAMGSNNFYWDTHTYSCEDFFVSMRNGKGYSDYSTDIRGSFSFADSYKGGIINNTPPNTHRDFSKSIVGLAKPVVGHETGQYQVYPDFDEMDKYTGVLKPINFEIIKKRLIRSRLYNQAEDFFKASGALACLCYREEIEMALRTPGFDGFQLLDLQDYPGQGTALVGILNAFMESKGLITADEWRHFCNDVVPLVRFQKYCWKTDDIFNAKIEVAHYGKEDMLNKIIVCSLLSEDGTILYSERFKSDLKQGSLNKIGDITIPLSDYINSSQKISLMVSIENSPYLNSWNLWVYKDVGEDIQEGIFDGVYVTRSLKCFEECKKNKYKVLYVPQYEDVKDNSVGGLFTTDFWNYKVFKGIAEAMGKEVSPGTMGLLINSSHPALKEFPTDTYTNWQWWNLVINSRPIVLDGLASNISPIVQTIDNWERNHKLGIIYTIPESDNRAIVCSIDLFSCKNEIEAKALFNSLLDYLKNL